MMGLDHKSLPVALTNGFGDHIPASHGGRQNLSASLFLGLAHDAGGDQMMIVQFPSPSNRVHRFFFDQLHHCGHCVLKRLGNCDSV